MKVKTSELTGAALDWAVAGLETEASPTGMDSADIILYRSKATNAWLYKRWAIPYSTDWAQGGPIIDRLFIEFGVSCADPVLYSAKLYVDDKRRIMHGPTHLIAAMRCYVASKLGDEVEIPSELLL